MEIRQFSNLGLRLIGGLLIYITLFKFTIGAVFEINDTIFGKIDMGIWSVLNVISFCTFCFVFFIRKPDFLTSLLYKRNYVFELNEQNQHNILKVIFLTFSIISFVRPVFSNSMEHFWGMIKSTSFIMAPFLIVAHKFIIKFMMRKINLHTDAQSKNAYIFSVFSILFFFCVFSVYGNFYDGPFYVLDLVLNFTILFLCICSPFIFTFLVKKETRLSNLHFNYILFFWILFLHYLDGFLYKFHHYEGDTVYLIKDVAFHVLVPFCFLCFHGLAIKIKPISSFRFLFFVSGIILVFCSLIKYLNQESTGIYFCLVSGLLLLFLNNKTSYLDKKAERIKFKKIEPIENIGTSNNTSFIIITLLVLLFFNRVIPFGPLLNILVLMPITELVVYLLIGKLAVRKQLKLNSVDDFIALLIILISSLTVKGFPSSLIHIIFNYNLVGPVESIFIVKEIIYILILLTLIVFSSSIAKMIKAVLPKSYCEKFPTLWIPNSKENFDDVDTN